ncbi:hypothetical protein C8F01DRAFT_1351430 [Mycena amicta]|nr:hypothetical protein C8F01DRAFT_1351430 [Mycena amicta]
MDFELANFIYHLEDLHTHPYVSDGSDADSFTPSPNESSVTFTAGNVSSSPTFVEPPRASSHIVPHEDQLAFYDLWESSLNEGKIWGSPQTLSPRAEPLADPPTPIPPCPSPSLAYHSPSAYTMSVPDDPCRPLSPRARFFIDTPSEFNEVANDVYQNPHPPAWHHKALRKGPAAATYQPAPLWRQYLQGRRGELSITPAAFACQPEELQVAAPPLRDQIFGPRHYNPGVQHPPLDPPIYNNSYHVNVIARRNNTTGKPYFSIESAVPAHLAVGDWLTTYEDLWGTWVIVDIWSYNSCFGSGWAMSSAARFLEFTGRYSLGSGSWGDAV